MRRAGHVLFPPLKLDGQLWTRQVPALPQSVVGVLHRKLGQGRWLVRTEGGVERCGFAHKDAKRPTVGNDVVHHDDQHVLAAVKLCQCGAQQWPLRKVEGQGGRFIGESAPGDFGVVVFGEVDSDNPVGLRFKNDLFRRAPLLVQDGAQNLVATHDF